MDEIIASPQLDVGLSPERHSDRVPIRAASRVLAATRREGRREEIDSALVRLAHLHFRQGHYDQAWLLADEVVRDALADSPMRCDALRILGNCAAELGDPERAEAHYHEAMDLARQLDYGYALYRCLHSLATNIHWPGGQFDLCLAAGKAALEQARELDLGEELWLPLTDIAWAYWSTGQLDRASQVADQVDRVVARGSLGEGFCLCLRAGLVAPGAGHLAAVVPLYERARLIAETTGDPGLSVEVRLGLCRAHREAGDLPVARTWADEAVAVSERMRYCQFQALALIERGRTSIDAGDLARAEADLAAALGLAGQLRSRFDEARACLLLAAVLSASGRPEADVTWRRAVQLIEEHGYAFLVEQERSLVMPWIARTLESTEGDLGAVSATLLEILASVPPAAFRVMTLGQFSLQIGPSPVPRERLRQRRAGELFALLLSSPGHTLSAGKIAEAMCPEKDPRAAVDFYHHAISALRRLLEPDLPDRRFRCRYLDVSEERVTLIVAPNSQLDFVEFEQSVRRRDWDPALRVYRGEFLPSLRQADWVVPLREHLADLHEQALLARAAEHLRAGDEADCLDLARRALLHNPWQEQAVELGMRAAMSMGDRATAIRLFQSLERTLERDLGIAPEAALTQLHAEIRNRQAAH
jgi:DNA-binding SARP family transcriptional activator